MLNLPLDKGHYISVLPSCFRIEYKHFYIGYNIICKKTTGALISIMRKKYSVVAICLLCIFTLWGCGGKTHAHEGEAKTPESAFHYVGMNYQEVQADFEESGFNNISTEKISDLVTGWLTSDGTVEAVSISGDSDFDSGKWYPANSEVVISYHTFPSAEPKKEEPTPDESVAANEPVETLGVGAGAEAETFEKNDETQALESMKSQSFAEETKDENLTVENCPELANIFTIHSVNDESYTDFVKKYKNKTIEFDGCITYLVNHDNYDTRYDLLLSPGDYVDEETQNPGPNFKFNDVNTLNLGIDDLSLPAYVHIGANVHVVAKVMEYNYDTGIFLLDPITVSER